MLEWTADSDECHNTRLIRFTCNRACFMCLCWTINIQCVCGVCFGTNGPVVVKPPIQKEMFASQGGGSVNVYSLSHMASLCVRVNFLTGRSKPL